MPYMIFKPFSENNGKLISYSSILFTLKVCIDQSLKMQLKFSDYIGYGIYLSIPLFSALFFFPLIFVSVTMENF